MIRQRESPAQKRKRAREYFFIMAYAPVHRDEMSAKGLLPLASWLWIS
jgi:hypothetical protein